jgi:membrane-associated HD superfamily phosphohydrolase
MTQKSKQSDDQLKDIQEIRGIMEKNTRFLSLSGLSGVFAGIAALAGAGIVKWYFIKEGIDYTLGGAESLSQENLQFLIRIAAGVLLTALLLAWLFTMRNAKNQKKPVNNKASRRWLMHLGFPLLTGGVFSSILVYQEILYLVPSVMLVFYGLALINAGKFTFEDITYLGFFEVLLGLFAALFPLKALWLWTIGFGVLHVIYGGLVYFKYDKS